MENTIQKKNYFFRPVPSDLRQELNDRVGRENARRIVFGFIVGVFGHIGYIWVDWHRMDQGLFEANRAYRWIYYNHLAWWSLSIIPIHFVWNWKSIRNGEYPLQRLQLLVTVGFIGHFVSLLVRAVLNFQFSPALGFYLGTLLNVSIYILNFRERFFIFSVSALVMISAIFYQTNLSKSEIIYWPTSILLSTAAVFLFSTVWYNGMVRQFLDEKMLDAQKSQLTEQAKVLTEQNQTIENDKALLAQQLEASKLQLNNFALRLAKTSNFIESIKKELSEISTPNAEGAEQKRRLLRKIEQENTRENDWVQFREQFEQVYPHFLPSVLAQFPTLSTSELRLMSLLKMNLGTQEIADILGISAQSLNTARYRLRKNLGLNSEEGLEEFLHRFK